MSGHSKWATTRRAKSVTDAKRSALFTKLARAIGGAVRAGGPNLEANFKLRLAVEEARAANMPKDNIERAIQRAAGQTDEAQLEGVTYEGFGPDGVAVIVECLTDNRNRTGSEIRHLFESHGGRIGTPGSVNWQFERTGITTVPALAEDDELALIDLGVSDVRREDGLVRVLCPPGQLEAVRGFFTSRNVTPQAEITLLPKEPKSLSAAQGKNLASLITTLDNHPDVQTVTHNAKNL